MPGEMDLMLDPEPPYCPWINDANLCTERMTSAMRGVKIRWPNRNRPYELQYAVIYLPCFTYDNWDTCTTPVLKEGLYHFNTKRLATVWQLYMVPNRNWLVALYQKTCAGYHVQRGAQYNGPFLQRKVKAFNPEVVHLESELCNDKCVHPVVKTIDITDE